MLIWVIFVFLYNARYIHRGLIQKEKVHINCQKGSQTSILVNKIATRQWRIIIIKESKQTIHYIYSLFPHYYVHMLLIWSKNNVENSLYQLLSIPVFSGRISFKDDSGFNILTCLYLLKVATEHFIYKLHLCFF